MRVREANYLVVIGAAHRIAAKVDICSLAKTAREVELAAQDSDVFEGRGRRWDGSDGD